MFDTVAFLSTLQRDEEPYSSSRVFQGSPAFPSLFWHLYPCFKSKMKVRAMLLWLPGSDFHFRRISNWSFSAWAFCSGRVFDRVCMLCFFFPHSSWTSLTPRPERRNLSRLRMSSRFDSSTSAVWAMKSPWTRLEMSGRYWDVFLRPWISLLVGRSVKFFFSVF